MEAEAEEAEGVHGEKERREVRNLGFSLGVINIVGGLHLNALFLSQCNK